MLRVELPQLVAGRALADALIDALGDLADQDVVVDATQLVSGTSSFAAQLVHRILVDGSASALTVEGGPDDFVGYFHRAATKLGVSDRLKVLRTQRV